MWTDPVSRSAQAFVDLFVSGKFLTLFAFMFGIVHRDVSAQTRCRRASRGFVANLTGSIGVPAGRLFYASTLALLWQSPAWSRRLAPFGDVGRTALSNDLFQSLVCTTLFDSWGGGFSGTVSPLVGLATARQHSRPAARHRRRDAYFVSFLI